MIVIYTIASHSHFDCKVLINNVGAVYGENTHKRIKALPTVSQISNDEFFGRTVCCDVYPFVQCF